MVRLGYTYSQPGLGDFGNTSGKKKKEDNITQNTTKNNLGGKEYEEVCLPGLRLCP